MPVPPLPPNPTSSSLPEPKRRIFDPWNSSSSGHQRAENRLAGSTSWRQSRTEKLSHQFKAGADGGPRIFDTVGAGSKDFGRDGRKSSGSWEPEAAGLQEKGWRDVGVMLTAGGKAAREKQEAEQQGAKDEGPETAGLTAQLRTGTEADGKENGIFANVTVYINGSTHPFISDHKLKQLLASHGAHLSVALSRRSVTHVILGRPNGQAGGAGGGLAGAKIQKEIQQVRGKGVKFVRVEWVLESVKAGKRLAESRFEVGGLRPVGVKSVYRIFRKDTNETTTTTTMTQK